MTTPEDPKPEEKKIYSLDEVTNKQAQINYLLNHTDMEMLAILKWTLQLLKAVKASPSLTQQLRQIDFTKIDFPALEKGLTAAENHSKLVADIRPPGCVSPYPLPSPPPPPPPPNGE